MPLWLVYHTPETFSTPESKQALAEDVTKIYTSVGLPAFYVVVNFVSIPNGSIFVGGKPSGSTTGKPFVRIAIDHIAVHQNGDPNQYARVAGVIEAKLGPHIAEKGYDWEFHVDETERGLWHINGFAPPPFRSAAEAVWAKDNIPSQWDVESERAAL